MLKPLWGGCQEKKLTKGNLQIRDPYAATSPHVGRVHTFAGLRACISLPELVYAGKTARSLGPQGALASFFL